MLINYPDMDRKTLPIGANHIDVNTGQVFLADGTEEKMYSPEPMLIAKSVLLYTDCSIKLELFREGTLVHTSTRFPTWSRFNAIFGWITITTTKHTSFYIQLSDKVNGVPTISQASYYEGNPFVSSTNVAVAGTPNIEEVYAGLGRNGRRGTLRHNGTTGILYAETSHDGITYADAVPFGPGDVLAFDGDDIYSIRIDTDTDDTPYVLIMTPEV